MAQELELFSKCPQCNGTGTFQSAHGINGSSITCNWPGCVNGYMFHSKITLDPGLDALETKIDDIKDKCDLILEFEDKLDSIIDKCDSILDAVS